MAGTSAAAEPMPVPAIFAPPPPLAIAPESELPDGWPYTRSLVPAPARAPESASRPSLDASSPSLDPRQEDWWEVFRDAELDRLERLAVAANRNLARAITRISQSRLQARIVAADLFPHLEVRTTAGRSVNSDNGGLIRTEPFYPRAPGGAETFITRTTTQNNFESTLRLDWEVDVFGRIRAAYASRQAQAQAIEADARGVRLSVTADVANGYYALRAADTQVEILDATAGVRRENLWLNEARTKAGIGAPDDVARARLELNNILADLAEARRQRHGLEKNLALLCGQTAPDFHLPVRPLERVTPPAIPDRVPAGLLTRRPDVAAVERRLAATLQDIRQARAEQRPRITVGGYVGQMSEQAEHFADRKSREASIMPVISLPVFEGGRLDANVKLAQARRDEAAADYQETVLTAFREADTALSDLRQRAVQAGAQLRAVGDARDVLRFSTDRYNHQTASYFQVVTDQSTLLSAQLNAARTLNARFAEAVARARALGGGWPEEEAPRPRRVNSQHAPAATGGRMDGSSATERGGSGGLKRKPRAGADAGLGGSRASNPRRRPGAPPAG